MPYVYVSQSTHICAVNTHGSDPHKCVVRLLLYRGCTYTEHTHTHNAHAHISRPHMHISGSHTHSSSVRRCKQHRQAEQKISEADTWGSSTQTRTHLHTCTRSIAHTGQTPIQNSHSLWERKHRACAAARYAFCLLVLLCGSALLLVEVEALLLWCPSKAWSWAKYSTTWS